jgi:hypothetical protein
VNVIVPYVNCSQFFPQWYQLDCWLLCSRFTGFLFCSWLLLVSLNGRISSWSSFRHYFFKESAIVSKCVAWLFVSFGCKLCWLNAASKYSTECVGILYNNNSKIDNYNIMVFQAENKSLRFCGSLWVIEISVYAN